MSLIHRIKNRDLRSNIPYLKSARSAGIFVNDISLAFAKGTPIPTSNVDFCETLNPLNVPAVPLEDCPTEYSKVDSALSDFRDGVDVAVKDAIEKSKSNSKND